MSPKLPADPRLANIDEELAKIVFEQYKKNIDLVAIHLRDARNMLYGARELKDDRVLAKGSLLLATAALESNLVYLSAVALKIGQAKAGVLVPPQMRYLQGTDQVIDDNGKEVEVRTKQSLAERLQLVPTLLARSANRKYKLKTNSSAFNKLLKTIARRDALVHPRWDKYVAEIGWWEAAEAIDAVELYLNSVSNALHPYLVGYFPLPYTIPGRDRHEVAVGHRTFGKKGPNRKISTMGEVGILNVLTGEWMDALLLVQLALGHPCERDSDGSMLTRAALVLMYAMLDAQLAVVAQWRMRDHPDHFTEAEILFLNEYAAGVGHNDEVWLDDDHQSFKKRIKAVPAVLSRRVDGQQASIDLGRSWGEELLKGQALRNNVMHSEFGKALPRISKQELISSAKAVFAYFEELQLKLPKTFEYMKIFLKQKPNLDE